MGNIQPLTPLVVVETTVADGIAFHADWFVTKVLVLLYFFRLWGYFFRHGKCGVEGDPVFNLIASFQEKKCP